jgi:hypothetical protein
VRIFKTKEFARFARREGLTDDALREAIDRADRGLIDADLGGGVIKQRVARPGQGRRSGGRSSRTGAKAALCSRWVSPRASWATSMMMTWLG